MQKQNYKFSPKELETIIDKNLTLYKYFQYLYSILKAQTIDECQIKTQSQINKASNVLIKCVISNYLPKQNSQTTSQTDQFLEQSELFDSQRYQYEKIQQILNSKQFIEKLHPYTNSLLTTTNIGIAKQALRIHMLMETNIDKTKAIHRIKEVVNILTLYQIQKNSTFVCCNLQQLNQIFWKIGLIISQKQYQFYYNELWDDLEEENDNNQIFGFHSENKQARKILQISDLLALSVEMQEIQVYKNKLRQWLNSDEYRKFYSKIKSKRKTSSLNTNSSNNESQQKPKQVMEQNLNIIKLKIQHMNPNELLLQLKKRQYNIDDHYKKWIQFRKDLLFFHDKQQSKKRFYNNIAAKTAMAFNGSFNNQGASLGHNRLSSTNMKFNKSILSSNGSRVKSNGNTGEVRRQMQSRLDQKAFNLKILNGLFLRQQILEDINQRRAEFVENGQDDDNYQLSEVSQNESRRASVVSKASKQSGYQIINFEKQNSKLVTKLNKKQAGNRLKQPLNKKAKIYKNRIDNIQSAHSQNNTLSQNTIKNSQIYTKNSGYFGTKMTNIKAEGFFNLGEKIMKK